MSNEKRKISMNVNGESKVPPGFRFHPTEEELLQYYLRKKVASENIDLDVIQDVDLNKLEPWDIQVKCNIGSTPQNDWYFFSHKDKKYPTGTRTNRATVAGFWKATGRDKTIHSGHRTIGMRKTLVFYQGRAPHGQKSDWIMHEYRLDDNIIPIQDSNVSNLCDCAHEEGWVVCRVFKKKNYHKSIESPRRSLSGSMDTREKLQSSNKEDSVLEQLLMYMDSRSCKQEIDTCCSTHDAMQQFANPLNDMFLHLPGLDQSPTMTATTASPPVMSSSATFNQGSSLKTFNSMSDLLGEAGEYPSNNIDTNKVDDHDHCSNNNWAALDKFVASQLDGQMEENKHCSSSFYGEHNDRLCFAVDDHDEIQDVWSLASRSSFSSSLTDPLCQFSV